MVGFCTGSGGEYTLKFCEGYPDEEICKEFPGSIRLAINVVGGVICVLDLFALICFVYVKVPLQRTEGAVRSMVLAHFDGVSALGVRSTTADARIIVGRTNRKKHAHCCYEFHGLTSWFNDQ